MSANNPSKITWVFGRVYFHISASRLAGDCHTFQIVPWLFHGHHRDGMTWLIAKTTRYLYENLPRYSYIRAYHVTSVGSVEKWWSNHQWHACVSPSKSVIFKDLMPYIPLPFSTFLPNYGWMILGHYRSILCPYLHSECIQISCKWTKF